MLNLKQIVYYAIYSVLSTLKSPLFWIVLIIIFFQYRKIAKMEKEILGSLREPNIYKVLVSMIIGLLGGVIGSILFIYLETTIEPKDFYYILPLALFLSFIHPRFICFSYAGGIISLISLLFGYPDINISGVMTVVAVLHLVESILIIIDGHRGKLPIFIKRDNQILGGFNMNRFWPVPFTIFMMDSYTLYPVTVIAVLGYGDLALTKEPKQKTKETASVLFLFSVFLLIFAQLSVKYNVFKYIVVLFSPIAHEGIIQLGRRKEKRGNPMYTPSYQGIKVLDTIPKGIGEKMGIKSKDIIISVNGNRVYRKRDISNILYFAPKYIWVDIYRYKEGIVTKEYRDYRKGINSLELLVIPKEPDRIFVVEEVKGPISRLFNKVKEKKGT